MNFELKKEVQIFNQVKEDSHLQGDEQRLGDINDLQKEGQSISGSTVQNRPFS